MAVYACADLHGRYDLLQQIKNFIKPEDKVYVLGDCGDRGPQSWKVITEVYNNPQLIYLKGNHEDMLQRAMRGGTDKQLYFQTGGKKTYDSWKYGPDKGNMVWMNRLKELPELETYLNQDGVRVVLCHAGYTPHVECKVYNQDLLWDRDHFNSMWDTDFNDTVIVHGHTPIPLMVEYLYEAHPIDFGAYWYCPDQNGDYHKCNIDCGAVFLGYTTLLNLDTFDEHLFFGEDCNQQQILDYYKKILYNNNKIK